MPKTPSASGCIVFILNLFLHKACSSLRKKKRVNYIGLHVFFRLRKSVLKVLCDDMIIGDAEIHFGVGQKLAVAYHFYILCVFIVTDAKIVKAERRSKLV